MADEAEAILRATYPDKEIEACMTCGLWSICVVHRDRGQYCEFELLTNGYFATEAEAWQNAAWNTRAQ